MGDQLVPGSSRAAGRHGGNAQLPSSFACGGPEIRKASYPLGHPLWVRTRRERTMAGLVPFLAHAAGVLSKLLGALVTQCGSAGVVGGGDAI